MSEEQMVVLVQGALAARGITDELLAAGQFNPRGHSGGMFAGGLAGSEVGGLLGEAGEAVSLGVGSVAGMRAADARSELPASMLIGVSATMVYGFATATRHSEPTSLVFQVPRAGLTVKVHQRMNVRVLELIDNASDARIELEGNRLPVTHSKDVSTYLAVQAQAMTRPAPADPLRRSGRLRHLRPHSGRAGDRFLGSEACSPARRMRLEGAIAWRAPQGIRLGPGRAGAVAVRLTSPGE
jgi:hypothetical protein